MSCTIYHEMISGYIDDELSKQEVRKLLLHVEQCERCAHELSKMTAQKERVAAACSSYSGPEPGADFAPGVMRLVHDFPTPARGLLRVVLTGLFDEFVLPFKRPAVAFSLAGLLVVATMGGYFLHSFSNHSDQQLLSVYELPAHSTSTDAVSVAKAEEEAQLHLFDHFARTSAETLATKPCILEYAAYTCSSGQQGN